MQRCKGCGKIKPLEDFYKHAKTSSGYLSKCKECIKNQVKANRELRKDYYQAYDRNRKNKEERNTKNKQRQSLLGWKSHSESVTRWGERNPHKMKANTMVKNALRDGALVKLPCFICGKSDVEGHHPDYSRPLDVVWLCVKHHKECHQKYDREKDKLLLETTVKGNRWHR